VGHFPDGRKEFSLARVRGPAHCSPGSFDVSAPSPIPDPAADVPQSQWFTAEVQAHEASLRSYLHGAFPSVRDVDDVVQESYLRIWRARAARPIHSARAFLFQVARRLAVDTLRRRGTNPIDAGRVLDAIAVIEEAPDAAELAILRERKRLLVDVIAALPNRYREIVILRKLEGVPQKEVAARLGLSERTVENLLARALKRCEARLRARDVRGVFEP
jgi:RNA polymerase sigma-70 factor (ECF subfamily)